MSFQIKDFASIVAGQINHARSVTDKLTDFAPGSVARTIMEAPAAEMEELYLQMFLGLRDAIPTAVFRSFDFTALPAAYARGYATVTADVTPTADQIIPEGTTFIAGDGRIYAATRYVTWLAGRASVSVPVIAPAIGLAGNVVEGGIVSSPAFTTGYTVSNPAITSGRDLETDAEREIRFAGFIQSLSRGTIAACRYAASQVVVLNSTGEVIEYVDRVGLTEEPGHVRIYIHGSGGTPSGDLLTAGQLAMDGTSDAPGYRAAGVRVDVLAMLERSVSRSIAVGMLDGYTLDTDTRALLASIYATQVAAIQPGATLQLGTLREALLSADGVASVVFADSANITCGQEEALVAGTLTITAA